MYTRRWTQQEKKLLKEHFPFISATRLAQAIPNRSPGSLDDMATRLGLRKVHDRLKEMGRENVMKRWDEMKKPTNLAR